MKKSTVITVIVAIVFVSLCVCFAACNLKSCNDRRPGEYGSGDSSETECLHENGSWEVIAEPLCEADGERKYSCPDCGKTIVETIPALGHNYVSGVCTRCGSKKVISGDTYTREGNYIYFGNYPQTKVTDSATLNALSGYTGTLPTSSNNQSWTDCEYYISGSNTTAFMWYKDVTYSGNKYRAVYFTSYRPFLCDYSSSADNSHQDNNGYNTGTVYWFKYEPIKWRILTEDDGSAFLMSKIAIDSQQYYHTESGARTINGKTVYENNYAESEIRAWLNQTLYNTAFSSVQKSLIKTTLVDNSAASTNPYHKPSQWNSGTNKYACENTNDKIFLLSLKEVTNNAYGFSRYDTSDTKRQLKSSDYAKSQGCWQNTDNSSYLGNCLWWLRSPGYDYSCFARFVNYDGFASYRYYVYNTYFGVVPALWLNL